MLQDRRNVFIAVVSLTALSSWSLFIAFNWWTSNTSTTVVDASPFTSLIVAHTVVFLLLMLVSARWYTERMQRRYAELNVRFSQERLDNILASAMDAIISIDEKQNIILFNQAAEKLFGYAAAEMIGQPLELLIPPAFRSDHREHVRKFGHSMTSRRTMGQLGTVKGLRSNGEEFPVEVSISQTVIDGKIVYSAIVRDISARQKVEDALRRSEALLAKAQALAHIGSFEMNIQTGADHWSRELYHILGREPSDGPMAPEAMVQQYVHPEDRVRVRQVIEQSLKTGEPWELTFRIKRVDGSIRHILSRGQPLPEPSGQYHRLIGFLMDETEKNKLEAQLLRAQRLESIGILSGGIAHDLNNMLTPIMMSVNLLRQPRTDADRQSILNTLQLSAERGAAMVKKLLTFTGGIDRQNETINVQEIVLEIESILQHTLPKNITLEVHYDQDLWQVQGDCTQLSQVLMNLAINARDAMPLGGKLTIQARNQVVDKLLLSSLQEGKPGTFVAVTVSDNGTGMCSETMEKIFDPFFTTKETGKGTGLGLSTVRGIVHSHGGFIHVQSEIGYGTQFVVYLPSAQNASASIAIPSEQPFAAHPQGLCCLIVDDEAHIVEAARMTLESQGYQVLTAANGQEALSQWQQHQGQIGAVLLDMMMPVMDGPATIAELHARDPHLIIIAMSGLKTPNRQADQELAHINGFLQKPFSGEQLIQTLESVWQSKSSRSEREKINAPAEGDVKAPKVVLGANEIP